MPHAASGEVGVGVVFQRFDALQKLLEGRRRRGLAALTRAPRIENRLDFWGREGAVEVGREGVVPFAVELRPGDSSDLVLFQWGLGRSRFRLGVVVPLPLARAVGVGVVFQVLDALQEFLDGRRRRGLALARTARVEDGLDF